MSPSKAIFSLFYKSFFGCSSKPTILRSSLWIVFPDLMYASRQHYVHLKHSVRKLMGKLLSAIWPKQTIFPFLQFSISTRLRCAKLKCFHYFFILFIRERVAVNCKSLRGLPTQNTTKAGNSELFIPFVKSIWMLNTIKIFLTKILYWTKSSIFT